MAECGVQFSNMYLRKINNLSTQNISIPVFYLHYSFFENRDDFLFIVMSLASTVY